MKKYTSWLGVMMGILLAVCGVGRLWNGIHFSNTILTGQVLQSDAGIVTLNLGELAVLQTPESAASTSLSAPDLTQMIRLSVHTSPNAKAGERSVKTFVSWQRDTVLDLSKAQCFLLSENGNVKKTSPESIASHDILHVALGRNNVPVTVFVLSGVGQSETAPEVLQGTTANLIEENKNKTNEEYDSSATDENALRIASASVSLHNVRINKAEGDGSDTEAGNRYGMNAALLATGGAQLTVTKSVVDSAVTGGNGIFGHGFGTSLWLRESTVTTTGDDSEGIQAASGADIQAANMTVITAGDSSPVLRVDHGNLKVNGGTYTSGGYQSPAILAFGTIHASDATFTANNSEAVFLRGAHTVSLENCNLRGNQSAESGISQGEPAAAVLICGTNEEAEGTAVFSMSGGSLISQNGAVFYALDADCEIHLDHVDIGGTGSAPILYAVGTGEERGTTVTLYASRQTLEGKLAVNSYSALHLELQNNSLFHGSIGPLQDDNPSGPIAVHIERGSTWSLTDDSRVDTLENEGTIQYNGYSITLGDGTVLTS